MLPLAHAELPAATGLLCDLMRMASPDDLLHHAQRGAMFKTGQQLQAVACKSVVACAKGRQGPSRLRCAAVGAAAAPPVRVYGGDNSHLRPDRQVLIWRHLGMAA
jgi:hypothetical protein